MKPLRFLLALSSVAIVAFGVAPAAAGAAGAVVPPSNSAAAQYTEAFPTSGGDKQTDQASRHRSPVKVLGQHKTQKLERQGPEGKAAAEVAAATAPTSIAASPPASTPPASGGNSGGNRSGGQGSTGGSGEGGGGQPSSPQTTSPASGGSEASSSASEPAGSSGIGSAVGQATGLSTVGRSGLLLLLVILATVAWSLFYVWRQRQQGPGGAGHRPQP